VIETLQNLQKFAKPPDSQSSMPLFPSRGQIPTLDTTRSHSHETRLVRGVAKVLGPVDTPVGLEETGEHTDPFERDEDRVADYLPGRGGRLCAAICITRLSSAGSTPHEYGGFDSST